MLSDERRVRRKASRLGYKLHKGLLTKAMREAGYDRRYELSRNGSTVIGRTAVGRVWWPDILAPRNTWPLLDEVELFLDDLSSRRRRRQNPIRT
jgi:hypothetical protein